MKISARNVFSSTIARVTNGALNSEIVLELPGGQEIVSIISKASAGNLELAAGKTAFAIVKANEVIVGTGLDSAALSARNVLRGKIVRIENGAVNSEIGIEIAGGIEITASITKASAERMSLKPGGEAFAVIKASSVIVGV